MFHLFFPYMNFFISIWVFFHDHSRITGLQGKGAGISLPTHFHFHLLHKHLDISRAITAERLPSRLESGTFGFRGQVANHQATRPLYEHLNNKITSVKHVCQFGLITLTRLPSLCAYFMDAYSCLADFTLPLYFW